MILFIMEVSVQHALILVVSLWHSSACAKAQWNPSNPATYEEMNRKENLKVSLSLSFSFVFIGFFLFVFFQVRARFFPHLHYTNPLPRRIAEAIERCPTFDFSKMKELRVGNEAEECAVCLVEFQDSDTVKMLPRCHHFFHQHCIDQWLPSCMTCPICRQKLISEDTEVNIADVPMEEEEEEDDDDDATTEFTEVAVTAATEQAEHESEADTVVGQVLG